MNLAPANRNMPNTTGWQQRHDAAMAIPRPGFEAAIVHMLRGWHEYAATHRARFESQIGDDGVLGPEWQSIGQALRGLLNGELGRLDGGTLSAFLSDTMHDNGASPDD